MENPRAKVLLGFRLEVFRPRVVSFTVGSLLNCMSLVSGAFGF
jgi:hypothetical protein